MKRFAMMMFIVVLTCCFSLSAMASKAKDECVSLVKQAAEMINKQGLEAAIEEINKKDGKFVTENTYVFLMNTKGEMLGHPVNPALIGRDLSGLKDSEGKEFIKEFIEILKDSKEGWVDYMWPKPGEQTPSPKSSFVLKVSDDLIVGAGYDK